MSVADSPAEPTYVPVKPYPVTASSILTQDYVTSDDVLVSADQTNMVAAFTNPTKHGAAEAFAIVQPEGGPQQVVYVARDPTQKTGWTVASLPDGPGPGGAWPATGVVAAVTGAPRAHVDIFWNDGSSLQHTWLAADGTFVVPRPILGGLGSGGFQGIGVTYAVPTTVGSTPTPVISGITSDGTVHLISYKGDPKQPWVFTQYTGSGFPVATPPTVGLGPRDGDHAPVTVYSGASRFSATMSFAANTTAKVAAQRWSTSWVTPATVFGQATTPTGGTLVYTLGTDGVPYAVLPSGPAVTIPASAATVKQACVTQRPALRADDGTVMTGMVDVYVLEAGTGPDVSDRLSLLRQLGWTNDGTLPLWAPPVPIAPGSAAAFPISNPGDPNTVFLADLENEGALAVFSHTSSPAWRNPSTGAPEWAAGTRWTGGDIRQAGEVTYEVTSYVTQVSVTDANGYPMANYALTLTASGPCGVVVGTANQPVGPAQSTTVTTNGAGTLTLSVLASDFAPPSLILTDPAGAITSASGQPASAVSICPSAPVQAYMGTTSQANAIGNSGALPYLPPGSQTFTAPMMMNAKSPSAGDGLDTGPWLFPGVQGSSPAMPAADAVTNVNDIVTLGFHPVGSGAATRHRKPKVAGFIIDTSHPSGPAYLTFESGAAMRTAWRTMYSPTALNIFHDAGDLFSDAWKGIKDGATKVASVGVDMEKGVVSMAIWVGKEATEIGDFVITCVEDACNAIVSVFSALEAAIKDIIDFLKALFDFGNILDTQWALTQALNEGLVTALELFQWVETELNPTGSGSTTFFTGMLDKINESFTQEEEQFEGQSVMEAAGPGWQPMGLPPNNTTPVAGTGTGIGAGGGQATPASVVANPQAMWLQDQLATTVPSGDGDVFEELLAGFEGPATETLLEAISAYNSAFDAAVEGFKGGAKAFEQGFIDLADAFLAKIDANKQNDPNNFENVSMVDLLEAENEFIVGLLEFLDAIALVFVGLVEAALLWIIDAANSELPKDHTRAGRMCEAMQVIYEGLWDLARLEGWEPPTGGWTPPAGAPPIPGWDPQAGLSKDLTYASLMGVAAGFPVTVIYELLTGKAPFPDGALPPSAGAAGAQIDDERVYKLVGIAVSWLASLMTTGRDTLIVEYTDKPDPPRGPIMALSLISGVWSLIAFVFAYPERKEGWWKSISGKLAALWEVGVPTISISAGVLAHPKLEDASWRARMLFGSSLFGVGLFVYATVILVDAKKKTPPAAMQEWRIAAAEGFLEPVPTAFSFLLLPALQDATFDYPIAGCLKLVLDVAISDATVPMLQLTELFDKPGPGDGTDSPRASVDPA